MASTEPTYYSSTTTSEKTTGPKPVSGGYENVPLLQFIPAAVIVGLPIMYLKNTNQQQWVGRYVLLIALTVLARYRFALNRFGIYVTRNTTGRAENKE